MKPLRDLVFIRVDEHKKQTESGILLAEKWKSLPSTGTVEAVGSGVTLVKKGDRVVFARYAAVSLGKDNLRAVKEKHIWGIDEK